MTDLAIIGLGPWGLCVLERTISRARRTHGSVRVHVVEPGQRCGGTYSVQDPDYLILNNPCGQLSLYPVADDDVVPPYAMGFHEWVVSRGYRWVGHKCLVGTRGAPILPSDYLPRRIMGEYLAWFYDTLVADAPPNVEVVRHFASAVDVLATSGGRETVLLDNGCALRVDHVVLTSGHTWNDESAHDPRDVQFLRSYPVENLDLQAPADSSIAIAGMGLVAFDLLAALTIGRGGTFEEAGHRKRYVPSGREPVIYLYSRTGMPYCSKSATAVDPYGGYEPVVCTPEAFAALTHPDGSTVRRQVDFRAELLPLVLAEMQARYYTHAAFLKAGDEESATVRAQLRSGWLDGHYDEVVAKLDVVYDEFDPSSHLFPGAGRRYLSDVDYESQVYEMIETDLDHALAEWGSPVKAAQEVLRIFRDDVRSVIEFKGLSLESYMDFQSNVRGRINRLEAGPPPMRSQQLLALLDAGVVEIPFGPNPEVSATPEGQVLLRSTELCRPTSKVVQGVVRGHLDLPSLALSASPLLNQLYAEGRLTQLSYGDRQVGSVAINEEFHPYDAEGALQPNLSVLGVLTEGVRYFTHYLPSPRSRGRAVRDAQDCVESLLS